MAWIQSDVILNRYVPPSWADGTDEEIAEALEKHYNDEIDLTEYWSVGDIRVIHLSAMASPKSSAITMSAQDITVVIVAMEQTDLETPINGHTKAVITVQTREILLSKTNSQSPTDDECYCFMGTGTSSTYNNTIWSNSVVRTYLNNTVYNAFDSSFKSMIKSSKNYRHNNRTGSTASQYTDNLFLPSFPEIYGVATYANYTVSSPTEGTQFEYYKTSTNRIKYGNLNGKPINSVHEWWNGSVSSYDNSKNQYGRYFYYYYYCTCSTSGAYNVQLSGIRTVYNGSSTYDGGNSYALAPAWAM